MLLEQQIKFSQSILSQTPTKAERRKTLNLPNLPHDDPEKTPEMMQKIINELNQKVEYYKLKAKQNEDPENLLKIIYEAFNKDLKGRLRFVQQIH